MDNIDPTLSDKEENAILKAQLEEKSTVLKEAIERNNKVDDSIVEGLDDNTPPANNLKPQTVALATLDGKDMILYNCVIDDNGVVFVPTMVLKNWLASQVTDTITKVINKYME